MLAAARSAVRRARPVSRDVPVAVQQAVNERGPTSQENSPPMHLTDDDKDGTLWTGYASGWIYDGHRGFYEHQPGFLKARPRC